MLVQMVVQMFFQVVFLHEMPMALFRMITDLPVACLAPSHLPSPLPHPLPSLSPTSSPTSVPAVLRCLGPLASVLSFLLSTWVRLTLLPGFGFYSFSKLPSGVQLALAFQAPLSWTHTWHLWCDSPLPASASFPSPEVLQLWTPICLLPWNVKYTRMRFCCFFVC